MQVPVRAPHHSPLTTGLLAAVSRSFYLSLRVLPKPVRVPLSLSYLLARAADTIADVPARPAGERLALLASFENAVLHGGDPAFFAAAAEFAREVDHEGERILLSRLPECWEALQTCTPEEAAFIRTVLVRIIRGQSLDLERFSDPSQPSALPDAAALEEYTWLVAGCVGEFWTEICALKIPRFASVSREEMLRHAALYGKGLQFINILRDQPKDMEEGRCYLPAWELHAEGLTSLTWPAPDWKPWHVVRRRWLAAARERLHSGRMYVRGLTSTRLRFAALLPLLIGEATLDLLDAQSDTTAPQAAKVTRPQVKRLMLRALWLSLRGKA
jgi:farnesyl-diphosphate farnesyltransferase